MPSDNHFNNLLLASISDGGLSSAQIAKIMAFRQFSNRQGFLLLEDMPIGEIPPTPTKRENLNKADSRSEKLLLQATALLGDPVGYKQESNGNIINNFFPQKALSTATTSDSYDTELDLHTENAFHAVQPDYLVLLCLRQDAAAEATTYVSSISQIADHFTEDDIAFFKQEEYNFLSDYCLNEKNCRIDINKKQTVLYGDGDHLFFRFDPAFMVARSHKAQLQLNRLRDIAWQVATPLKLKTGDLLIIDNRKTAHARSPFPARFDGSDRWIQRTFAVCNHRFYIEKLCKQTRVFDLVAEL